MEIVILWFWEVKVENMHRMKSLKMQSKSFKNPNQPTFLNAEVFAAEKKNELYWLQPPVQGQGGGKKET